MPKFLFFQRIAKSVIVDAAIDITVQSVPALIPSEWEEKGRKILNKTTAKPLFEGVYKESKYFPIDFQYTSLTITMLIKDEKADRELMKLVDSGDLEKKLNEIISKFKTGIKIIKLNFQEREDIEYSKSFEELEKKALATAHEDPIIKKPSPLKVSSQGLRNIF